MWPFLMKGDDNIGNLDLSSDATTETSIPGNAPNPTFSTAQLKPPSSIDSSASLGKLKQDAKETQQQSDKKEEAPKNITENNKQETPDSSDNNFGNNHETANASLSSASVQTSESPHTENIPQHDSNTEPEANGLLSLERSAEVASSKDSETMGLLSEPEELNNQYITDGDLDATNRNESSDEEELSDEGTIEDNEESFYQLIDSDDVMLKLYSTVTRIRSKTVEFFVRDGHVDKLLNILVNSQDAFLRRYEEKNKNYHEGDYNEEPILQYDYHEFDELDYYYDNLIVNLEKEPTTSSEIEFDEEDYNMESIKTKVKEHIEFSRNKTKDDEFNVILDSLDSGIKNLAVLNGSGNSSNGNLGNTKEHDLKERNKESGSGHDQLNLSQSQQSKFTKEDEKTIRRCNVIAEVYASDIPVIMDTFISNNDNLAKLWTILEKPSLYKILPLVQLFVKINETLLIKKTDLYLNFIRLNINLVDRFVKRNIDISLLNEFLIKLIITDKVSRPTGIIEALMEQSFIQHLLNLIDDKYPFYIREFAGDLIKNLVSLSTYTSTTENDDTLIIGPNSLTRELVSHKSIWKIANKIKQGGKTLFILVDILIELIRKNNADYDDFNLLKFSKYQKLLSEYQSPVASARQTETANTNANVNANTNANMKSPLTAKFSIDMDEQNREEFNKLIDTYPPSDHDPIYLNNILKIFSFNLPWIYERLNENLGHFDDSYIFDEKAVDYYFFESDPNEIAADQSNEASKFTENKQYIKQTFGYIEKLSFDKLKLVELVAELLHCSNIKLYNNRNAEWLINQRNDLIEMKRKFLSEAIDEKLSLLDKSEDDIKLEETEKYTLPVLDKQLTNTESFIAENDEVEDDDDDDDDGDEDDDESYERFHYENGSESDFNIDGPEESHKTTSTSNYSIPLASANTNEEKELSETERKAKKESMLSKLALKIDNSINNKVPVSESDTTDKPSMLSLNLHQNKLVNSKESSSFHKDSANVGSDDDDDDDDDSSSSNKKFLFAGAAEEDAEYENLGLKFDNKHPFVSTDNDKLLRDGPSLGDFFKIRLHDVGLLDLVIRKMFTKYPWNNFWHNVVFDLIQQLLNCKMNVNFNSFLVADLFTRSRLIDIVLVAYKKNKNFHQTFGIEFGYMGHVSLVSEEINKFTSENDLITIDSRILDYACSQDWFNYINKNLTETRNNYSVVLGGKKPNDDIYYRNPDTIVLAGTEKEIQDQDLMKSNPEKLKELSKSPNLNNDSDDIASDGDSDDDQINDHTDDDNSVDLGQVSSELGEETFPVTFQKPKTVGLKNSSIGKSMPTFQQISKKNADLKKNLKQNVGLADDDDDEEDEDDEAHNKFGINNRINKGNGGGGDSNASKFNNNNDNDNNNDNYDDDDNEDDYDDDDDNEDDYDDDFDIGIFAKK